MTIRYYSSVEVMDWNEIAEVLKEDVSHFHIVYKEYKKVGANDTLKEFVTSDLVKLERIIYDVQEQAASWVEFTGNNSETLSLPLYEIINVKGITLH
ncbi:hypothetical protein NIGALANA_300 [Bacillus phage Nigalana]|uniref:Uncharacterized protein n=6 Tax=Wphvirus TaxID=1922327 RepID=A0A024B393_9CAUD|nr:hypothetical protein FP75_gp290 [Bacillus phage Megatron]YP_009036743.1 hypothetical protein FP72_gp294 [Bacillus phage Hakuna]YP_009212237.1 hypothetical protein QLX47_gp297 [Bacillus phage Eyuki]YP_009281101.1 hypothetical protein SAGEFAYGE_298 [Bacillus phage SageFayge]YP_009282692.1 hypothetical protein BI005_gp300 [Bacillus phage Nigalana]YP_009285242.1 hypothetical protein BIZ88_gp300 [Bacillus phage DirtyBetty]YP_009287175.1 hypothetical protein BI006_gp299 [Bacillus phage Nemo]ANI